MGYGTMQKIYMAAGRKNVCFAALFITAVLTLAVWKIDTALAGTGGRGSLYLQLSYTKSNFEAILSTWRGGGVDIMMNMMWLYFLYPAACAVLLSSAMAFFTRLRCGDTAPAAAHDLVFFSLPLAGGAAGWAAQFLLVLIFKGVAVSETLLLAESVAASFSWALFVASLVLVLRSYVLFRKGQKRGAGQDAG